MSKVYDALVRSQGVVPENVLRALKEHQAPWPGAGDKSVEQTPAADPDSRGESRPRMDAPPHPPMADEWGESLPRVLPARVSETVPLLSSDDEQSYTAEQYRIVRTRIVQRLSVPFLLAISSPGSGEGKTVSAVHLSTALALKGERPTLLVDADLRRSGIHRQLKLPQAPGLAEILAGTCALEDAIVRVEGFPALHVLTAGLPASNASDLLASSRWRGLSDGLRRRFAYVIVDCPPMDIVADYDLIAAVCDGVLLVLRPDHTDRTLCMSALTKARPKLTGVLINAAKGWFLRKEPNRYYYGYYGREGHQPRHGKSGRGK